MLHLYLFRILGLQVRLQSEEQILQLEKNKLRKHYFKLQPLMHLSLQQTFIKHLSCAKHCAKEWRYKNK